MEPIEAPVHSTEEVEAVMTKLGRETGSGLVGWCLTMLGQPEKGMTQLTRGLAAYRAQGLLHLPTCLTLLADAYRNVQQPHDGLRQLAEAVSVTDKTQRRSSCRTSPR